MEKFKNAMAKVWNCVKKFGSFLYSCLKCIWKGLTAILIAIHIMKNADEIKEKIENKRQQKKEEIETLTKEIEISENEILELEDTATKNAEIIEEEVTKENESEDE